MIRRPGEGVRSRPFSIVLNAVEGWGKTTVGAFAPKPLIAMSDSEQGYLTLLEYKRVPDVPTTTLTTWPQVLGLVEMLTANPGDIRTLVFDALGGIERLCHAFVCKRDFADRDHPEGNWGEKGFASYGRGPEVATNEWRQLIGRLVTMQERQPVNILILSHCKVKTFKNPEGADYDRYTSDCHEKTWGVTHKWADAVLMANFYTVVQGVESGQETKRKGKAIGDAQRIIYTERRASWDAKNRYGMPAEIDVPNEPSQSWATIENAMKGGELNVQ